MAINGGGLSSNNRVDGFCVLKFMFHKIRIIVLNLLLFLENSNIKTILHLIGLAWPYMHTNLISNCNKNSRPVVLISRDLSSLDCS